MTTFIIINIVKIHTTLKPIKNGKKDSTDECLKAKKSRKQENQQSQNQWFKPKKGRKRQEEILGIISNHREKIRLFITMYQNGELDKPFSTGMAALTHWIYDKELLCYTKEGKIKSLSYRSVDVEVRAVWKEMQEEETNTTIRRK